MTISDCLPVCWRRCLVSFWLAIFGLHAANAQAATLDEIKKRASIKIAVYNDFWPFHEKGQGIEVDLANAIASKLGVQASLLPFEASDESMDDDLRNMVWKGHYLGWGPADLMLHVPVSRELMSANPRVTIFSPYMAERLAVAYRKDRIPNLDSFAPFASELVGTETASISSFLLLSAEGGKYKQNVRHYRQAKMAVAALKAGELAAVMALRSEVDAGLKNDPAFAIADAPIPQNDRTHWAIGMAVSKENQPLAEAVASAMNQLREEGVLSRLFAKYGVTWRAP